MTSERYANLVKQIDQFRRKGDYGSSAYEFTNAYC